jgi:predicted transcriptional regulator of viral defense system
MSFHKTAPAEFDYIYLMDALKELARPRDRVTALLKDRQILRVKKGLYVRNDRKETFSREILANLIYGPSYLSLEYALAYHGLSPEALQTATSVTTQKNKVFETPVGRFEYRHLPLRFYSNGIERIELDESRGFLVACPEKALFDTLYLRTPNLHAAEIEAHLFKNLRIDEEQFLRLAFDRIEGIISSCSRASIVALRAFLNKRSGNGRDS